KEGTPLVGDTVIGGSRQNRIAGLESGEIVPGPTGELTAENVFDFMMAAVKTGGDFLPPGGKEQNPYGAIVQGVGQSADPAENRGGEGFERADGIAVAFAAVSAGALFVSGVEQAAQFFGAGQVGIHFVEQQGRLVLVHQTKEHRGGNVLRAQG